MGGILNLFQDLPVGLLSNKVILEGFCPVSNPYFITTDPGLQLSRMTATTLQKTNDTIGIS